MLSDEDFQRATKEDLESCKTWKLHIEYDLAFSDIRTNKIYISVSFSNAICIGASKDLVSREPELLMALIC